jgi:transposase-like protein
MARPTFPKTLREFREQFASESDCLAYLWQSRWPEGFRCPRCGGEKSWPLEGRWVQQCQACAYQSSPTAGTLLHRSHFSLREWFWAAYLVATHTPGMSATQLQRQMGCSYKTAWYLLHRLRRAMVSGTRSRLSGSVEADEAIIGGPVRGKRGRGVTAAEHSTLVFGAVEVIAYADKHGGYMEKAGRLRLAVAPRADAFSIRRFLEKNVEPGSEIDTDQWRGYSTTALAGYGHELHHPETHALHIHRAFGNLKTWLNGTHHGVDPKYLQNYLDEFVFRFNRRKTPMAAFQTLLGLATQRNHVSLANLTEPESTG